MDSSNGGPSKPTAKTYNLLYAKSSNRCAFPGCNNPITIGQTLVGNVCHIKAARPGGPRYDPKQKNEERHGYENLLLMCSIHNKVVDSDQTTYTVQRLIQMKVDHEAGSTSISDADVKLAVGLLVSVNGKAASPSGDITVSAINPQNSVVAGVYQNITHNYGQQSTSTPAVAAVQVPSFVFVFGAPLGDNHSATWIMTLKHYGPSPAHNCTIDFYDKDRINIRHEWSLKHPGIPFPPAGLVGEFRHQARISEAGPEGPLPPFNWTPLDPDRQHYSVSISSRDGVFVESWEVTRVSGCLRGKITIERGPQWVARNPHSNPLVFKLEDPEFISVPLLTEAPQMSAPRPHPGWKPSHRFEIPVVIIDPNHNMQVLAAAKAPDGRTITDFGTWNILKRHYGDDE